MTFNLQTVGAWIGTMTALVGALYSGSFWIETRYAKTSEMQAVQSDARFTSLRLEEKILTDRVAAIQSRLWSLEDRYQGGINTAPNPVREEYRQMVIDLADVQRQIQSVMAAYRAVGYPASPTYYHYEQPHR